MKKNYLPKLELSIKEYKWAKKELGDDEKPNPNDESPNDPPESEGY